MCINIIGCAFRYEIRSINLALPISCQHQEYDKVGFWVYMEAHVYILYWNPSLNTKRKRIKIEKCSLHTNDMKFFYFLFHFLQNIEFRCFWATVVWDKAMYLRLANAEDAWCMIYWRKMATTYQLLNLKSKL